MISDNEIITNLLETYPKQQFDKLSYEIRIVPSFALNGNVLCREEKPQILS